MEYVWYASYGSNISNNRFLCYIGGGRAKGALSEEVGARNHALPLKYEMLRIGKKQYFATESKRWQNQGVAFISSAYSKEITLGKMYLITKEQFEDVVKQENNRPVTSYLDLKLDQARHEGSAIVIEDSRYGRILFLGQKDGAPIYSFTNPNDLEIYKKPSSQYLLMIASGILENYQLSLNELCDYFMHKKGIESNYSLVELKEIFCILYKDV